MTKSNKLHIDQYVPCMSDADAVSLEVLHMRDLLLSWGYSSQIYTETPCPGYATALKHRGADVVIYHLAVGSALPYLWASKAEIRVLRYHNVTPPYFFPQGSDAEYACERAVWQLGFIETAADFVWCDSKWNTRDFLKKSTVFSVLRKYEGLKKPQGLTADKPVEHSRFLTVGHYRPHKGHVDLLFLCALWKQYIEKPVQMIWVGSWAKSEWPETLSAVASQLGVRISLGDLSGDVCCFENIPDADLARFYESSHAYLSMSEHEGVGLPLLEAASFGLPVLAYDCGGVRETLEGFPHAHLLDKTDQISWLNRMLQYSSEKFQNSPELLPEKFQWNFLVGEFQKEINKIEASWQALRP